MWTTGHAVRTTPPPPLFGRTEPVLQGGRGQLRAVAFVRCCRDGSSEPGLTGICVATLPSSGGRATVRDKARQAAQTLGVGGGVFCVCVRVREREDGGGQSETMEMQKEQGGRGGGHTLQSIVGHGPCESSSSVHCAPRWQHPHPTRRTHQEKNWSCCLLAGRYAVRRDVVLQPVPVPCSSGHRALPGWRCRAGDQSGSRLGIQLGAVWRPRPDGPASPRLGQWLSPSVQVRWPPLLTGWDSAP